MKRRTFLKSLLAVSAATQAPKLLATPSKPTTFTREGLPKEALDLLGIEKTSPQRLLKIDYSWLGSGHLNVRYLGYDSSEFIKVSVLSKGDVINVSHLSNELFLNVPVDSNTVAIEFSGNGIDGHTFNLAKIITDKYKPGESFSVLIDVDTMEIVEPYYSWVGKGDITFNGEVIAHSDGKGAIKQNRKLKYKSGRGWGV